MRSSKVFNKYTITAFALLVYLFVISRASYLSTYVQLILVATFCYYYRPKISSRAAIWFALGIFYLMEGLLNGNNSLEIFSDAVHLMPIAAIITMSPAFKQDYLQNQFAGTRQLLPFCLVAYYVIFTYMSYEWMGSTEGRFVYDQDVHLSLNAPTVPLFIVFPLLCISGFKGNTLEKVCLILGALAIIHFGFITSTKSKVLGIFMILILRIFFSRGSKSRITYLLTLTIISYLVLNFVTEQMGYLTESFMGKFELNDDSNTSRWDEGMTYLSQCNSWQLLFGKGFGGIKTFHGESYIGGLTMLHMGWCYLIMKGGILLLCIIYFPLFYIILKDFNERNYAYVIFAIFILFTDQMHTTFTGLNISYWILVYLRFYNRKACPDLLMIFDDKLIIHKKRR